MEYWKLLVGAYVVNALCLAAMYAVQYRESAAGRLPERRSWIPGTRQDFLYLQDFHTTSWGDLLTLPPIAATFAWLKLGGYVARWEVILMGAIALIAAKSFRRMCLSPTHKPDMGYPGIGEVGRVAWLHEPYFGLYIAMAVICIGHLLWLPISYGSTYYRPETFQPLLVALTSLSYLISFWADIKSGNFDQLKAAMEKYEPQKLPDDLLA